MPWCLLVRLLCSKGKVTVFKRRSSKFIVHMQEQNNRTDSMIIGIGAAHAGAPAMYYMGAV